MSDSSVRPLALMVGAQLLLVLALVGWALAGFPLLSVITGGGEQAARSATGTSATGASATGASATPASATPGATPASRAPASAAPAAAAPAAPVSAAPASAAPAAPAAPVSAAPASAAPARGAGSAAAPSSTAPATPPQLAPVATADHFDGARAFALVREQVNKYGYRPAGSASLRRLAERLRALLPVGRFEAIPGHKGLRNIVGSIPGHGKAIVLSAHYDVIDKPKGFVGANDGAAGTAAVVWLARALARAPRLTSDRPLRFVLFDGEEEPADCNLFLECALRGSKPYAKAHAAGIESLVLLDYIGQKHGLHFVREGGSNAALWGKLRTAADAVGVGSLFSADEGGEVLDDHTPFTDRGVPAIDLIDFDYPPMHTLRDNLSQVSERSIDAVGEAVYQLMSDLRRGG
jgi:glutaminyl-peptide cyclotransferase